MPVKFDSAAQPGYSQIAGAATSGSVSIPHNVNPLAADVTAIVGVLLVTGANQSSSTCTVTFGGVSMTQLGSTQSIDSGFSQMRLFTLDDPPTGARNVVVSVGSLATQAAARFLYAVAVTEANVASVGTPVTAGGSSATSNSITVSSVLPAYRVVTLHGVGSDAGFTTPAYTQTPRGLTGLFGALLIGDAPGAASVTAAVAHTHATSQWAAMGVSLTPTPVVSGADLIVPAIVVSAGGGTYRTATPVPERYYEIPTAEESDLNKIAGSFVRSADGVEMPVWEKDPQDTLDYTLDWHKHIAEDDEIISVTFTPTSSALTVFSSNISESTAVYRDNVATSCWFTGGVPGVNYGVTAHVTTAEGRQHDRTFRIVTGQN